MHKSLSADFQLAFVGIGASKSGTTWLAVCLGEHPQVCLSRQKDIQYFGSVNTRLNSPLIDRKGEVWLQKQFLHWRPGQLRGEISASYLHDPQSPRLIKTRFPDTKIIVSFRDPVERLYSIYYHYNREFIMPGDFEEFLEKYPQLIPTGFYYTHLQRYLEYFPKERIHFILFDDIGQAPRQVLADLFGFLGVDDGFLPPSWHKRFNEKKLPRLKSLKNLIGSIRNALDARPSLFRVKRLLTALGAEIVINSIYAANLHSTAISPMGRETRLQLLELYAPENELLGKFINKDLTHWNE